MAGTKNIPMKKWGKDHWSVLAYIECRCVDNKGQIDRRHLRVDPKRHPDLAHVEWDEDVPTILAKGEKKPKHDDIDCIEDLEKEGIVKWLGTGINPVFELTDFGLQISSNLRKHKSKGGNFASFRNGESN